MSAKPVLAIPSPMNVIPSCSSRTPGSGRPSRPWYQEPADHERAASVSVAPAPAGERPRSRISINGTKISASRNAAEAIPRSAITEGSPRRIRAVPGAADAR